MLLVSQHCGVWGLLLEWEMGRIIGIFRMAVVGVWVIQAPVHGYLIHLSVNDSYMTVT